MIVIVASNKDAASLNIRRQVLNNYTFMEKNDKFQSNAAYESNIEGKKVELITLNSESIYAQNLAESFTDLELVIFISRHSSISGTPTLSVHTPGNLAEAELGGITKMVSISPANSMRIALRTMSELTGEMGLKYDVSYEATHHGPSLNLPTMFVELGSSPQQWSDLKAADVVARSALEAIRQFDHSPARTVIGIGGPHYSAKFTRMALETDVAFGHIVPKYAIPKIDSSILRQCAEKTVGKVDTTVLDWKGIRGEDRANLVKTVQNAELKFEKA
jgi:D-aminoacyl-tRNA deacylase